MLSSFASRQVAAHLKTAQLRTGAEVIEVSPAYTSVIGAYELPQGSRGVHTYEQHEGGLGVHTYALLRNRPLPHQRVVRHYFYSAQIKRYSMLIVDPSPLHWPDRWNTVSKRHELSFAGDKLRFMAIAIQTSTVLEPQSGAGCCLRA